MRKIIYVMFFVLHSPSVFAVLNSSSNASTVSGSAPAAAPDCDNLCDKLVTDDGKSLKGLDGSAGWKSGSDDQWCADHGSPTEASIGPNTNLTRAPANSCNVPMFEGENCSEVNNKLMHCKWHNSQLEPQCMAYKAADGAGTGEHIVFALDTVAAASCWTACIAGKTPWTAALEAVCMGTGIAAGASEFGIVLAQNSSPVTKMIKSATLAGGTAAHTYGLSNITGSPQQSTVPGTDTKVSNSCFSAAGYTILMGLRYKAINDDNKVKKDACNTVKQLASSASMTSGAVANLSNYSNMTPISGGAGGLGRATAGGSAGGVASASAGGAISLGLSCVGNNGLSSCLPNQSAAMDSKIFSETGLDKQFASDPNGQLKAIIDAVKSGATAGQIMDRAMNGSVGGDAGHAISQLADEATAKSTEIAALMKPTDAAALASTGGLSSPSKGGGKGSPKLMEGFNLFGGFGNSGPAAESAKEMRFEKGQKRGLSSITGDDIYHSNWTGSIFDLVSTRIDESKDRVMTLEWSTPLNRALNGLSNQKKK